MSEAGASIPETLGRYQVAEELGRGAMGIVYLAVDPVIARPVAIKVVKESENMAPADVEQFYARFRHEAEAAGRLSHPDIVRIYDIGPNYIVMEYIEGRPLSVVLEGGAVMPVRQIVALVQRVAEAIDYAHKYGIVHRDIKPGNVMLLDDGNVRVMDFGVARLDGSNLTAVGSVVGSVRYMAPEQMMGEKVDGRADIFSLAAVAYELLTAHPPFPGKTITEVVSRVVRGGHVPACQVDSRLPGAVEAVFAKAFATRPGERYARATDFARDLTAATKPVHDLLVAHGNAAATPTEVDATAVKAESFGADSRTTAGAPALAKPASADETVMMGGAAPAVPPPRPLAKPAASVDADATVMAVAAPPADPSTGDTQELPTSTLPENLRVAESAEPETPDAPEVRPLDDDLAGPDVTGTLAMSAPLAAPAKARGEDQTPATARTVIMDLTPKHREGVLMLDSDPPGASVFVDGEKVGQTPLPDYEIGFGKHSVRLEAKGRQPLVTEVEIDRVHPLSALTVSLAPERSDEGELRPGQFFPFGPEVVPPCRVAGSLPAYPESARERGLEGSPVVELWIGEKGDVMDVAIVESAGATLDGALLEAVAAWRFTPARVRGVPVVVRMRVQHHFRS
jgi:serine/threonine-protein kinase